MKRMERQYIAHEDVVGLYDIDLDLGTFNTRRVQGREIVMNHSKSDLLIHRACGFGLVVLFALSVIFILGIVVS